MKNNESPDERTDEITNKPLNILVVEDDPGLRRLIKMRLERKNFEVDAAESGHAAIEYLTNNSDVILLLDYKLPDMTGRELIEKINNNGFFFPFVLITGHGDERIAVEMMKLGAKDYLVKDQSFLDVLPEVMEQVSSQEMTQRKFLQVRKALKESEERFRMLFNSGTDAIYVQEFRNGTPGKFIEVNDVACQRLGYTRDELFEKSMNEIEIAGDTIANSELSGGNSSPYKYREKHHRLYEAIQISKRGEKISVENNSRMIDLNGKPVILCISRDITPRKQLEEQLRQAQKMEVIGKLAGGVAHDFNNLLTAIMGYSDLLLVKMDNENPYREGIEQIKQAGKRAAALTQQLLAFSRKQMLKPKVLSLNKVVSRMGKMLERIIGEDIRLLSQLDTRLYKIKADPSQLEQVILNLAVNAVDAMPRGGNLIIRTKNAVLEEHTPGNTDSGCSKTGNFICLSICDSGEGIDKKIIPKIFEPFFTTKTIGTGLGLSVVYGIVKQHNGWIDVSSSKTEGSTFNIYFPAFTGGIEENDEQEQLMSELKGNGERILLVEDESEVRDVSAKALRDYGYDVTEAVTVSEARNIFEKEKGDFHLVVSDIILPDKTGIELYDNIRFLKPGIRILLTSGYADHRSYWQEVVKKNLPYLQKPYSLHDLLKNIKELFNVEKIKEREPEKNGVY